MFTYTLVLAKKKKNRRFTDALQFPVVTSCHCGSKGIFVCLLVCLFCLLVVVVKYEFCSTYICPQPHGKAQATVRSNFKCQVASEQILAEPEPHKDGYLALKQLHKSKFMVMTLISYSLFVFSVFLFNLGNFLRTCIACF